jgi:hypothetical protein
MMPYEIVETTHEIPSYTTDNIEMYRTYYDKMIENAGEAM